MPEAADGDETRIPSRRVAHVRAAAAAAVWASHLARPNEASPGLDRPDAVLDMLEAADPTPRKSCLQWICQRYARGGLLADGTRDLLKLEDLGRLGETLAEFERWKHRLPVEARDLNRHQTEADVWTAVSTALGPRAEDGDPTPTGREARRRERARALQGTVVMADAEGWLVASPTTEAAAVWWGRGTRWCTAATKGGNAFEHYASMGRLMVVLRPDGGKFQIHVAANECRSEEDRAAERDRVLRGAPEAVLAAFRPEVAKLPNGAEDRKLRGIVKAWMMVDGLFDRALSLRHADAVADHSMRAILQTGEVLDAAVRIDPSLIEGMLRDPHSTVDGTSHATRKRMLVAVAANPRLMSYPWFPRAEIDDEMVEVGWSSPAWGGITCVPPDCWTDGYVDRCLARDPSDVRFLKGTPFLTRQRAEAAVEADGALVVHFAEGRGSIPRALIRLALSGGSGPWIASLNGKGLDESLAFDAVDGRPEALEHLPWDLRTPMVCRRAMTVCPDTAAPHVAQWACMEDRELATWVLDHLDEREARNLEEALAEADGLSAFLDSQEPEPSRLPM